MDRWNKSRPKRRDARRNEPPRRGVVWCGAVRCGVVWCGVTFVWQRTFGDMGPQIDHLMSFFAADKLEAAHTHRSSLHLFPSTILLYWKAGGDVGCVLGPCRI